jgi:hypothetical protein
MSAAGGDGVEAVLRVLADLSPSGRERATRLSVPTEWFRWLPAHATRLFAPTLLPATTLGQQPDVLSWALAGPNETLAVNVERRFGERLAAVDLLRPEQRSLRAGWLFVAGRRTTPDGKVQRVLHPLVTVPVRVVRPPFGAAQLLPAGDVEVTELVTDPGPRRQLEGDIQLGGGALGELTEPAIPERLLERLPSLLRFARQAAQAAGFDTATVVGAKDGPERLRQQDGLVIVAGVAVYAVHDTGTTSAAGSLRLWAQEPVRPWTALHAVYLDRPEPPQAATNGAGTAVEPVVSPYPLTPAQAAAVRESRLAPVTVISGAPGTGKSHTVAAIACDALARGERVLVAAKTDATVDALLDLLQKAPGPEPIVFGSDERREALARRLAGGQLGVTTDAERHLRADTFRAALGRRDRLAAEIEVELEAASALEAPDEALPPFALVLDDLDLDEVAQWCDEASEGTGWWMARRRRRRTWAARLARMGGSQELPPAAVREAVAWARVRRARRALLAEGGLAIGSRWDQLEVAEAELREATARHLAAESRSAERLSRQNLGTVAALATALRAGRASRREMLARLHDGAVTRALPLWAGTLADIDDLLPPIPALFDLVIVDEASSVDQPLAAPALLRGARAVVVGDPRQLRHVSFLSGDKVHEVTRAHGIGSPTLAARLDVRRNSLFDVAAGVAPVVVLDEHFRSVPHLVEFVADRLYEGTVKVATRSPHRDVVDCVEVVTVDGPRMDGAVPVEIDVVLERLRRLRRAGAPSVGVVTPFRAQADALEAAVLKAFDADDIAALGLRVGTVHSFQGNERDVVLISVGAGSDASAGTWRFVEDPHLFTVLATRARRQLTVVLSGTPPADGLLAAYLAQADSPPGHPRSAGPVDHWTASLVEDLRAAGSTVLPAYPAGRHVLDVALGAPIGDVVLECSVHPGGPAAHVERHLALRRSGWTVLEAHRSRWEHRRGELVVELLRTTA